MSQTKAEWKDRQPVPGYEHRALERRVDDIQNSLASLKTEIDDNIRRALQKRIKAIPIKDISAKALEQLTVKVSDLEHELGGLRREVHDLRGLVEQVRVVRKG